MGLCGVGRIRIPREGHFGIFEPATGHPLAVSGISGALVILGPMMDLAHDRWVIEASWGLVYTDTDSVVHRGDLPQMGLHVRWSPPCASPSAPKVDRLRLCSDCIRMLCLHLDHPDALSPLGLCVANTAGRRRRSVATRGGSPRDGKPETDLRACRAISMGLGPQAVRAWGASHTTTPKHRAVPGKCRSAPSPAHWPPHCEERSGQLRHVRPLRGPPPGEWPIHCTQGRSDLSARGYAHGTANEKFRKTRLRTLYCQSTGAARVVRTGSTRSPSGFHRYVAPFAPRGVHPACA